MTDKRSRRAVQVAERRADGSASRKEVEAARKKANAADNELGQYAAEAWVAESVIGLGGELAARNAVDYSSPTPEAVTALLREVFGYPARPAALAPSCRVHSVVSLARATYEERSLPSGGLDPGRLAVLSDALEEAGRDGQEVLGHLRSPRPHVRGCRALDLILDKG